MPPLAMTAMLPTMGRAALPPLAVVEMLLPPAVMMMALISAPLASVLLPERSMLRPRVGGQPRALLPVTFPTLEPADDDARDGQDGQDGHPV